MPMTLWGGVVVVALLLVTLGLLWLMRDPTRGPVVLAQHPLRVHPRRRPARDPHDLPLIPGAGPSDSDGPDAGPAATWQDFR